MRNYWSFGNKKVKVIKKLETKSNLEMRKKRKFRNQKLKGHLVLRKYHLEMRN